MTKTTLVTGGTGFLGSNLIKALVKRGDLLVPFEVCPIEPDEVTILGERRRVGFATALVPGMHQLLIGGPDGCLVRSVRVS